MYKTLAKDIVVYGFLYVSSRLFAILVIPVYARLFSTSEFALYDFLFAFLNISVIVSGMQVESGIAREFFEYKERNELGKLFSTGFVLVILGSVFYLCIAGLIFKAKFQGYKGIDWSIFLLILYTIPFFASYNLVTIFYRFERDFFRYGILTIGDMLVSSGLGISLIYFYNLGVEGIFIGMLVSKVVFLFVGIWFMKKILKPKFSLEMSKEILKYSFPLIPSVLAGWGQNYANRFILISKVPLSEMGIFSLGARVAAVMILAQMAFRMAWVPHATKLMGKKGSEDIYAYVFRYYLLAMGVLGGLLIIFSKELVLLFGGIKYFGAGTVLGLIVLGHMFLGGLAVVGLGNLVVRKTYYITIGVTIGSIVNVSLLYFVVEIWGIIGAGISFLLGSLVIFVLVLNFSQKNWYVPYDLLRFIILLVMMAGLFFFSFYFGRNTLKFTKICILILKGILYVIFISSLWWCMLISKEKLYFKNFVKKCYLSKYSNK